VTDERGQKDRIPGVTEGVALAVVTALAYACAYLYEAGFAHRLGIPTDFVEVRIGSLVVSGLGVVGVSAFAWLLVASTETSKTAPRRAQQAVALAVAMTAGMFVLQWYKLAGLALIAAGSVVAGLGSKDGRLSRFFYPRPPLGYWVSSVAAVGAAGVFAWWLGSGLARDKDVYCVQPGTPEFVLLRAYGDRGVAATFDRAKKRLGRELRILPLDETVDLRCERIGPLTKP